MSTTQHVKTDTQQSDAMNATDTHSAHQYSLRFDEALMLSAARTYCWREIGWTFVLVLLGIAAYAGFLFVSGDRSWTLGVACAVVVFAAGLCVVMYRTHTKRARESLRRLADGTVTLRIDERGLHYASPLGTALLQWSDIARITRTPAYWLLHYRQGAYATLPIACIDEAGLRRIDAGAASKR